MSYKDMSEIVILNQIGKANDEAKADLYETYDQLRDLTVSGPTIGGGGIGAASGLFTKFAQLIGGSSFSPIYPGPAMQIPGTSYFSPVNPGTGVAPGGQSSFGTGPWSQTTGLPGSVGGSAAGLDATGILASLGTGNTTSNFSGIGDSKFPLQNVAIGGSAAGIGSDPTDPLGAATGVAAASGFGTNLVLPAAGIASGIGGLLTSLSPLFGGTGLAGLAAGTVLSGLSGSILATYQNISNRVLNNADTMLTSKVKNIETVVKQMDAQEEVVKKLLKDGLDSDRKALQDLS